MRPPTHPSDDNEVVLGPAAGLVEPADLDSPAVLESLSEPVRLGRFGHGGPARRCAAALGGVVLIGVGVGFVVSSTLGAGSLDSAGAGLAATLGVAPGWGSAILCAALVAFAALLGHRPGPVTLAVVFGAAPVINVTVELLAGAHSPLVEIGLWVSGMGIVIAGASLLVAARLGAASLELATLALAPMRICGRMPGVVGARYALEAVFLVAALCLGGPIGIGTLACTVLGAPALRFSIPVATAAVFGPLVDAEEPAAVPAAL